MNRRHAFLIAGPVVVVIVAVFFYASSGRYVSTDNAFLKADKVVVSAEVAGTVRQVLVEENKFVRKGHALLRLDSASYSAALVRAQAAQDRVRTEIAVLQADWHTQQAALALAEENLEYASQEYRRQIKLAEKKYSSQMQTDDRKHALDVAQRQKTMASQLLAQAVAKLGGTPEKPLEQRSRWREATAEVEQASLNLAHTTVRAPFDGVVSNVPEEGKYLSAGNPALTLVANTGLWVEANFKETDLSQLRLGQPVRIHIDTYPNQPLKGHVLSISPASGAEFAILPPQNASGNWVQVVQRIPVRIVLEREELKGGRVLRAGMSVDVTVDTGADNTAYRHFSSAL